MNRNTHFGQAVAEPMVVNDSRFGVRELVYNKNQEATTFSYSSPGKGPNGEHQN
jgi:hypothetical protein